MNMSTYRNAMAIMEFDKSFETNTLLRLHDEGQKHRRIKKVLVRSGFIVTSLTAAAAILALSARTTKMPRQAQIAAVSPTASIVLETAPQPEVTVDMREVIPSSRFSSSITDSYAAPPDAGQTLIARDVSRAFKDPANADAYCFVKINIFTPEQYANPLSEYVYNGRSVADWRVLADLENGTYPYNEYNGDHGGNVTKAQWLAAQEVARTADAQVNLDIALAEYEAKVIPMLTSANAEREEAELKRLQQLGYDIFFMETWSYVGESEKQYARILAGVLSAKQMENMSINSPCGFFIDWVTNGDGIVNWDETLRP